MEQVILSIRIKGTKEEVWDVITDIGGSVNIIKGIDHIEILEKPSSGFKGLKWKETRTFLGHTATEVMWITDSDPYVFYTTRAESHGAIYRTRFDLIPYGEFTELTMAFRAELVRFLSKLVSALSAWIFVSATRKALIEDLNDIKAAVEGM